MPNDLLLRLTLHGGVIPGVLATALLAAFWIPHARRSRHADRPSDGPRWLLPLLIAGAFIAADFVVKQSFDLWPRDNTKRALHAAALLGLVGAAEGLARLPAWAAALLRAAAFALAAWMLTEGYAPHVVRTPDLWGWVLAAALGGAFITHAAESAVLPTRGWTGPAAALALLAGVQPAIHFLGFSSGSLALTGPLAALSAALLVSVLAPTLALARGTTTVLVGLVLISLLGAGIQSAPASVPALFLLALSPLALSLAARNPLRALALRAAAAAAITGVALAVTLWANQPTTDQAEPDPSYEFYVPD